MEQPKNCNRTGRSSDEEIRRRHYSLQKIINDLYEKGIVPTNKRLLQELARLGFKIDRSTLYRDRVELSKENTFVRDIAESTYSQMIEDLFNNITHIEDQAFELAEKKWVKRRIRVCKSRGKKFIIEEEIHDPAGNKEKFLKLALDCLVQKMALMKGDLLNVSVAMLSKKLDEYKRKLQELTPKK